MEGLVGPGAVEAYGVVALAFGLIGLYTVGVNIWVSGFLKGSRDLSDGLCCSCSGLRY